jgi:trk system potassium uptake protein TrkH
MFAGRLELFPLIILFHPGIWREAWDQRKKKIIR